MPAPGVCMSIINARQRKNGIGSNSNPEKFLDQDFQRLKQYCQIRMVRYIDEMFPPDRRTIGEGVLNPADLAKVVWLRPHVSVLIAISIKEGFLVTHILHTSLSNLRISP